MSVYVYIYLYICKQPCSGEKSLKKMLAGNYLCVRDPSPWGKCLGRLVYQDTSNCALSTMPKR